MRHKLLFLALLTMRETKPQTRHTHFFQIWRQHMPFFSMLLRTIHLIPPKATIFKGDQIQERCRGFKSSCPDTWALWPGRPSGIRSVPVWREMVYITKAGSSGTVTAQTSGGLVRPHLLQWQIFSLEKQLLAGDWPYFLTLNTWPHNTAWLHDLHLPSWTTKQDAPSSVSTVIWQYHRGLQRRPWPGAQGVSVIS